MIRRVWLLGSVLLTLTVAPTPRHFNGPQRVVLSSGALTHIVGGLGAAAVSIAFPANFATAASGSLGWNIDGNRCQYTCSSFSPTDIGFDISMQALTLNSLSAPSLLIVSDGSLVATGGSVFGAAAGSYNYYTGHVRTQCVGGSNAGNFCTRNGDCAVGSPPGNCRSCDLSTTPATCNAPPNTLGPCNGLYPAEEACYLLPNCATGTGGGCTGETPQDCFANGAGSSVGTGPFHSAIGSVTVVSGGSTFTVGQSEDIYQIVKVNNTDQTKCHGLPDPGS